MISFGSFTALVDPLDVTLDSFVVGNSKHVHASSSSCSGSSFVQMDDQQPSGIVVFPMPILKKGSLDDNLNLGSSPSANVNDFSINSGGRKLVPLNSVRCSRCLRRGHFNQECPFPVRCLICFNYGHRARQCFSKPERGRQWKP